MTKWYLIGRRMQTMLLATTLFPSFRCDHDPRSMTRRSPDSSRLTTRLGVSCRSSRAERHPNHDEFNGMPSISSLDRRFMITHRGTLRQAAASRMGAALCAIVLAAAADGAIAGEPAS